jgi:hypothetical protein
MRLIADIYDRPSVDFCNKADLAALASGRCAPQADVPEKSAFDLDRAKTSSEGRRPGGQIQDSSQAAIGEVKRFDPDGVHDAGQIIGEKVPSRRRPCRYAASSLGALKHYGSLFFEIAGQRMSVKSAVSRIAGYVCSKDLYRRQGYCQSIRQIGQKRRPRTVRSL